MQTDLTKYLPTFLQVAQDLNFSESARKLGITPAAVSKTIKTLEEGLGTRLFHRSTHALTLTGEGTQLFEQSAPHQERIAQALASAMNLPSHPQGKLRVAAPYAFSKQFIIPLLGGFRAQYPDVELDLLFDDQVYDMVRDQIDVSIGMRLNPGANLIMKKLCDSQVFIVASPEFLERHGTPTHPSELVNFPAIRFRSHTTGSLLPWTYVDEEGRQISLTPPPAITVSSMELLCELAAQGLGITMTGWVALPYISSGELMPILDTYTINPPPISIFYHDRANLPAKVRVFIDYVVDNIVAPNPDTWRKKATIPPA